MPAVYAMAWGHRAENRGHAQKTPERTQACKTSATLCDQRECEEGGSNPYTFRYRNLNGYARREVAGTSRW